MKRSEFILQGFSKRTHKNALAELFKVENIQSVLISVAYVSKEGIEHIERYLRKAPKGKIRVLAGMNNNISSYDAFSKLLELGFELYAVDTGAANGRIFHPKVYLVRGKKTARILVGSSNLTLGGLNNNIEAGMMLHLTNTEADKVETNFAKLIRTCRKKGLHADEDKIDSWKEQGRLAKPESIVSSKSSKAKNRDIISWDELEPPFSTRAGGSQKPKPKSGRYTEKYHLEDLDEQGLLLYKKLRRKLEEYKDTGFTYNKFYMAWQVGKRNICYMYFRESTIWLTILRGSVDPRTKAKTRNFFTLDNSYRKLKVEVSKESNTWGFRGKHSYWIEYNKKANLDHVLKLLNERRRNLVDLKK